MRPEATHLCSTFFVVLLLRVFYFRLSVGLVLYTQKKKNKPKARWLYEAMWLLTSSYLFVIVWVFYFGVC